MTASTPHLPNRDPANNFSPNTSEFAAAIDVEVMTLSDKVVDMTQRIEADSDRADAAECEAIEVGATLPSASQGGALATQRGSFSTFLAPLTQDSFKQVVSDVESKLRVVNQTLSMLDNVLDSQGFDAILDEMLRSITLKTGELLNADRTTIFLLDEEKDELWSIVAKDERGNNLEFRFPITVGIAGEVATHKTGINIPYDFYDDPRSKAAQEFDKKNHYRTYTMLALPLLNDEGNLVAVVQLINKLKAVYDPDAPLEDKIDLTGFTQHDEHVFEEFAPSIRLILESSRSFYKATQQQRAASALMKATKALSQSSLDLEETLSKVMEEAQELMQADRSTLWLVDAERGELWTKLPVANGTLKEFRIPRTAGFAGQVAESHEPLLIPFDLYDQPGSEKSKETDQKTGYRTCSMLCMPVFNADGDLIGVTQLVNKKKQGDFPPYDPANWPQAPDCWKASFNRNDQEFMKAFNIQAGVALQNAKLFATVKQQEQMQRDILRSLSNAVLSTDKEGRIIAANESAKALLGLSNEARLEGRVITEVVQIKEGDFSKWFTAALKVKEEKNRQQYYPDQTLLPSEGIEQHSVHLSINSIADATDCSNVYGALVVMDDISDEKRLKSTMYRYMTQELAEQLLSSGDAKLGGDRKEVSVLFSDIRGYTSLTETLEAEEVVQMLNDYFEAMVDAVFTYKGTLDKYIGDAIMAVFGSPLPLEDHAWMAVQTAIEMRHRLAHFNSSRSEDRKIRIGIGINSDSVISGNIGSSKRMEFTAIGDGVNLGSRLESASKQYGCDIVVSETTYKPCADRVWTRELDCIRVKGKNKPVSVYELVGLQTEAISDEKRQIIEIYQKGREYYLSRKFTRAMTEFGTILEEFDNQDKPSLLHLKRCQHWLNNPPSEEDWEEGVWKMTEK
jgi:adenylate cyclase